MTVSFTGISNIKVFKKKPFEYAGFCTDSEGFVKRITKSKDEMMLKFDVCNDAAGNDLDEFNKVMAKTKDLSPLISKNADEPRSVKLLVKHLSAPEDELQRECANFSINDISIPISKNSDMATLSYLAKLTQGLAKKSEISDDQKDCIKKINKYIHQEALKYINR